MSIEAIVNSKNMVGDNKPTAKVEIGGGGIESTTDLYRQASSSFYTKAMSRWIPKISGGYMCCYLNASKQLVTGYSSDLDFLDTDDAIESETTQTGITVNSAQNNNMDLVRLSNGTALLFILDVYTTYSTLKCYRSASGNGGDWVYLSEVHNSGESSSYSVNGTECHATIDDGSRIFVSANVIDDWLGYAADGYGIFTSDDNGATWSTRLNFGRTTTAIRGCGQVAFMPDRYFATVIRVNYTDTYESTDGGDTWAKVAGTSIGALTGCNTQGANFYYESQTNCALLHLTYPYDIAPGLFMMTDPTAARLADFTNFERVAEFTNWNIFGTGDSNSGRIYSIGTKLASQVISSGAQKIYISQVKSTELQGIISVSVNHKLGSASEAIIKIDNPDGIYSYDAAANLHLVGPNKEITIYMGYGTDQEKVFYGLIDGISEQSFPQCLVIAARDMGKKALDGTITDASGWPTVLFANSTPEAIFATLAGWAGYSTVITESSGIIIASKKWNWAKFADAFNWLCDLAGFDWFCDTEGILYFKKRATNTPRSEDEEHVLVLDSEDGKYKCTLDHSPILDGSYAIKNAAEDVTYTEDTDYTLDLATGELESVAGGALASGGTIHPKYTYPRFVFQEGVSLTKLNSYDINDKQLFYKIYAYGTDSTTGEQLLATWVMSSNSWNVLESKRKKVQIDGTVSQTELQAIVDAIGADMLQKARSVKCTAIGVPSLMAGECIQAIESSSTMSEIYKTTAVTHTFDGTLKTSFSCYHYGYAPITEGGS